MRVLFEIVAEKKESFFFLETTVEIYEQESFRNFGRNQKSGYLFVDISLTV